MKTQRHCWFPRIAVAAAVCIAILPQVWSAGDPGYLLIGQIKPRPAKDIASSSWSVGGETLDRDFTVYANYKKYLGPLGAKGIRVQAGWAKCEKKPGVYDWAWLDEVVNDSLAQGVQPWLETSYGNTIYPGGGGTGLGGGFPTSPEALTAWDNWVRALAQRYKDRVREWEVWNEPDGGKSNNAEKYTSLFVRTATIIRAEQPGARIYGLGLAGNFAFAEDFLRLLKEQGKTGLLDAVTFHGYPRNPDDTSGVDKMRSLLAKYAPKAEARQGETGAPSKFQPAFALANIPWSETTQAKWDLRRMLAHHAKDTPFNLFTIIDMHYVRNGKPQMNWKGLLESKPDQTVDHVKPAYYAAQRVFAIFDDSLQRVADFNHSESSTTTSKTAVYGWRKKDSGALLVAVWFSGGAPTGSNATTPMDLILPGAKFTEPVYADLLTGKVYAIPRERWSSEGGAVTFRQIPVCDSPALIVEKAALTLEAANNP
ncbi:MAG: hypothetical protein NTX50_04830 [Candidatus Sumerlaeota bacterium]|nr:hypothetical protein [Candidatus Sumerlaeota bacterium]